MKIYRESVFHEWRQWFAWRPVRTQNSEWVWLETVERKSFEAPIPNIRPLSWIIYKRLSERV